ncbi:putative HAF family extracellular repeat protein, partial [Polynucleobacter sphagniphilus]|nr:putative HAF family extracellular repeat protein [Polynucleobacter sphagniphilus]
MFNQHNQIYTMKTPPLQLHKTRLSLFAALAITLSGGVVAQSMSDLGTLGGTNTSANGVSADGSVIVGYSQITGDSAEHAFKYTGTTMSDLGTLGGTYSSANGGSADGSVIVGYSYITGNNASHAFKYSGGTMSDLGTLGGTNSSANGVSADGSVIVGYSQITG